MRADRSQPTDGLPPAAAEAMRWLRRRKRVLPLLHKSKEPAIKGGLHAASGSRIGLKAYAEEHPYSNYGLLTGAATDLVVLDIDGPEGEASLRKLERRHGPLPKTVEVRAAKGRHIYLSLGGRAACSSVSRLGRGLDVRGDGSYVVAAGSLHPSGHCYAYVAGHSLDDLVALASAPAWLVTAMNERREPKAGAAGAPPKRSAGEVSSRTKGYAAAAVVGELDRLRRARPGQRNNALNVAAFKLGRLGGDGNLDVEVTRGQLAEAGRSIGLEAGAIDKTIASGLRAGLAQPRAIPKLKAIAVEASNSEPSPAVEDPQAAELALLGETDADNADRFARRHRNTVAYVPGRGILVYEEGIWRPGGDTIALRLAEDTARGIVGEAAHLGDPGLQKRRQDWSKHSPSGSTGATGARVGVG
jgi:putative DNA primase/helicase